MATSSLSILAEDVISQVLYFTPCIWDVLHFTATSQRFHSVAEEHLKTLTYLYIRLPFQLGSPQAEPIKEGIKTLVKDRLSTRLTVVDILNPRYWLRELDLWTRLQLVSERVKHIICKNTDSALYDLMCLIAIDGTTIKKHHRRHLQLNGKLINDLVRLIDSNEKHPFEVAEMLSSVETLDIHLDGLGAVSYVDWTTLFPNLKVLGLGFRFFGDTLSPEIAPTLIRTIGDMKEEGKLKLNYFEFLTNPALASLLQGYLSRLCIDWNVEYRGFPPPFDLSSYEKLEAKISGFLEDTETFLSAICRSKQITFYYSDLEKAMRLI
ncbi:hypothetical protein HDE_12813 [Halotydeus destructor]|nr:hypothetical protein HDE_12813 [Halotydeus destructor]